MCETLNAFPGAGEAAISFTGRYVAYQSAAANLVSGDLPNTVDIFLRDRVTGVTTRESLKQDGEPLNSMFGGLLPEFSADERYISYLSSATVVDSDANLWADVHLRAIPPITVTGIAPNTLEIGKTTVVPITGSNFLPGAEPDIQDYVTSYTIDNETTTTAVVTVPAGEDPGPYNVVVIRSGSGPGLNTGVSAICQGCVALF